MKYLEFKKQLKDFIVFPILEIKKLDASVNYLRRVYEWQKKGYIKKVIKSFYIFSDLDINEEVLFIISNKIYKPSYISFEMALSYYNLIPESVYGITAATSRKTSKFYTEMGGFFYRSLKPNLMFGYKLVKYKNQGYLMADIEKAILDFFYLRTDLKVEDDFSELRINARELLEQINSKKLRKYLSVYKNKSLEERIERFVRYIKDA